MSFTYDEAKLGTDLYRVRFEIGDTNDDRQLLQDEEINQIVDEQSTLFRRAAACCRAICAKYAGDNDYKIGPDSEKLSQIYDKYLAMAKHYEAKCAGVPWAGGVYTADKDTVTDDTSLAISSFKRGIHDNP